MDDPNIIRLREMRSLALQMCKDYDNPDSNGIDQDDAEQLASMFIVLDDWLTARTVRWIEESIK